MIKTVVLIPLRDNEDQPFDVDLWRELHTRLLQFGGISRTAGVEGTWEYQGRVYHDESYQYRVSLRSWDDLPLWLAVIHWAQDAFRQEALYIEVAGVPEIIGRDG
ncbi:MAG: hypothetical protein ACR2PL_20335 [Dehalococcoidia bacterium]